MKTLEKQEMMDRNKVMRVLTEERILQAVDHPFLASLYATIQTPTHLHFIMEYCEGGELYGYLTSQPHKRLKESHMRFYAAEVGCMHHCSPNLKSTSRVWTHAPTERHSTRSLQLPNP